MDKFMKYFFDGIGQSIVVGVPNFDENNQYKDGENLYNDFYIAKKIVLGKEYEKTRNKKRRK